VRLNNRVIPTLSQLRALSSCTNRVLVPFAESTIPSIEEGNSDQEARKQIMRAFVGLAGESRVTDANSPVFHIQGVNPAGLATGQIEPVPPTDPRIPPPHRPDVPCETQEPPNLDAPSAPATAFSQPGLGNLEEPPLPDLPGIPDLPTLPLGGTGNGAARASSAERQVERFLKSDDFTRLQRRYERLNARAGE